MLDREQIILDILKDGEKRWKELVRLLVSSGKMSRATLSLNLQKLEKEGKIRRVMDQSKKPPLVLYMLSGFESMLERKVKEAVDELRGEFFFLREPTVKEVASRVGELPEKVREILYNLAPKIGWKEQEKDEAEKEAENAINLAGWLKWLKKGEQNSELAKMAEDSLQTASGHIIEMAKRILENFPQIVPEAEPSSSGPHHFVEGGLEWKDETLKAWRRVFKSEPPVPRRVGFWVIPRS
jgi:DNA-binding MarR family transcriptional regulator